MDTDLDGAELADRENSPCTNTVTIQGACRLVAQQPWHEYGRGHGLGEHFQLCIWYQLRHSLADRDWTDRGPL